MPWGTRLPYQTTLLCSRQTVDVTPLFACRFLIGNPLGKPR
jgi:hypothetical protein